MTAPAPGEIVLNITGRDIWEKLDNIEKTVSGIPAKVEDHETRLRSLERKVWVAAGFAAAGGAGISQLAGLIGK